MSLVKSSLAAAVAVSLLAGCQTFDPYTGEKKVSNATKFGAIGAVICGAIGSRKSGKRARNAALGCGLIGAGIGAYMDSQEEDLRRELAGSGIQVERDGDNIRLVMPNSITFDVNQSDLKPGFFRTLNAVSKVLAEYNETKLNVAGHTDSTGPEKYNYDLSVQRANSVAVYLKSQQITSDRVRVTGFGESRPIASNSTRQGQAENRRVELLIEPKPAN